MALLSSEMDYFVYENRLASFKGPQPISKRRTSTASSRAPKALTWPHKKLPPASFAKAGFVFQPTPSNPDNVVCFLCDKHLDGWEEDDNPLIEHLKHVPDCGWAIVAAVEAELGEYAKVHPLDPRMVEARKATFGSGRWPYDGKKGWKCKTKQLVEGGWYYSPTDESDDMATCAYCQLALDGWEAGDKPIDEHHKRSPDCAFFQMIHAAPAPKKPRKGRATNASRLSMQSVATTMSDLPSAAGDMTLDPDMSVMTTTSVATTGGKKGRPRKAATAKTRKTKAKKEEAVEVMEDGQDAEIPPPLPPKQARGRKRVSDEIEDSIVMNVEAPPPKKRVTRGKSQAVVEQPVVEAEVPDEDMVDAPPPPAKQPVGRKKGRASAAKTTTRKASAASLKSKASTASLRAQTAQEDTVADDDLDKQLQEDMDRPLTEDEYVTADSESERNKPASASKKGASKKATSSQKAAARSQQEQVDDYAMFDPAPVGDNDAQVEEELRALQAEMEAEQEPEVLVAPKKGKKAAGTRKASKQTKKTKEPEVLPPLPEPVEVPVEEPAEDSVAVTRPAEVVAEPELVVEDPDTSSGTVVNKTATAAKRGRGRPKKNSTASDAAANEPEPEPVVAAQPPPQEMEVEAEPEESISLINPTSPTPAAPLQPTRNTNKSLPPAPPSPPPQSEKPFSPVAPTTPRAHHTTNPSANAKQPTLSPSPTPQSSDAENQPPSSKPSASSHKRSKTVTLPPPPSTPGRVPSSPRRNAIGRLQTTQPWAAVDLDLVFALAGEVEGEEEAVVVQNVLKKGGKELTTPEKEMTVEEWIYYNARVAEGMLRDECEGLVGRFEVEGGRAMRVLEGLVVE
ncbi:hypothetical protein GE09DRAFT_1214186 [Coniochaeta sp. 2T2.1]|nr:hypothetical protein GE09DRAFT_1214186 [Coniochaeta sp. 2T2.1]